MTPTPPKPLPAWRAPENALRRRAGAALLSVAGLLTAVSARADWPMARHDAMRSAFAPGKSNITKPQVAWQSYLGGGLSAQQLLAADVDGDGHDELIRSIGGSIAAIKADGTVVWKAPTSGVTTLVGIVDLAGDGRQEVVGYDALGAVAVEIKTGTVVWKQPVGEMGQVRSNMHIGDVNGDGHPDIVIGECRGCGGDKMQTGFIYSFANGFGAPIHIPLPFPQTNDGPESTLADMDGQGGAEVLLGAGLSTLALVDGKSGSVLAVTPDLGVGSAYVAGCLAGDVDGIPGDEAVCVLSGSSQPTPSASEVTRVFALKWKPGSMTLDVLWSYTLEPSEGIANGSHDLLVDLDGDGHPETLVTGRDAAGNHTVHILDSSNGKEIASIPGETLVGTAAVLQNGRRLILTSTATGTGLWRFGNGGVKSSGTLTDDIVINTTDWSRFAVSGAGYLRPVAIDADGDGAMDILAFQSSSNTLHAYRPGMGGPKLVDSLSFTADDELTGLWSLPPIDQAYPQLAVTRADGFLRTLDHGFNYTSVNVRIGGFYLADGYRGIGSTPVVASLDGGPAQQVLVADGRRTLIRLDAAKATPDTPPVVTWSQPQTYSPVVAPGLDGDAAGIFAIHVVDPTVYPVPYTLRRLHADGSTAWEAPIAAIPPADIVTGKLDGDGIPDVALQSVAQGASVITTQAISGVDGHAIWTSDVDGCPLQGEGVSLADWDGDGLDDVMQQANSTHIASGADGHEIAKGGPPDCYFLPIPVKADQSLEVVYTAGVNGEQGFAHDLSTMLFQSADDDRPFPYGSIAQCPDGPVFVQGSLSAPSRIKLTPLAGPSTYKPTSVYLAGGQLFQDQASADMVGNAQLTPASIHANLTGNGAPAAVLGAPDGWLYAIDPCSAGLVFAYQFEGSVGEPVFGDTDGDGLDEILVTVADGYLYALHNEVIVGTGGSGGSGGTGGTGGVGGTGGAGTGGHRGSPWPLLYGRGGCYCGAGSAAPEQGALLAFAIGLAAAAARRRKSA